MILDQDELRLDRSAVQGVAIIVLLVLAGVAGIAIGYGFGSVNPSSGGTQGGSQTSQAAAYTITLMITTNNLYDPIMGEQPAYYVVGPTGLESSASISFPVNQIIRLVIVDYDNGAPGVNNTQAGQVTGTQNDQEQILNNTLVNSTISSSGIEIRGVETVSSVPLNETAHTFTIPSLGINIPVPPLSTVVTYLTIKTAGTYNWLCLIPCGGGPQGIQGAMDTPGWMLGTVRVS